MNIKIVMLAFFLGIAAIDCNKKEGHVILKNNDWINDKNGCNGVRNIEYARNIIKMMNLQKESYDTFTTVFGAPDIIEKDTVNKTIFYYADSSCKNGKIIQDSDKCFVVFYFKNDKFTDISMKCE